MEINDTDLSKVVDQVIKYFINPPSDPDEHVMSYRFMDDDMEGDSAAAEALLSHLPEDQQKTIIYSDSEGNWWSEEEDDLSDEDWSDVMSERWLEYDDIIAAMFKKRGIDGLDIGEPDGFGQGGGSDGCYVDIQIADEKTFLSSLKGLSDDDTDLLMI